jgi:hypothetical protein
VLPNYCGFFSQIKIGNVVVMVYLPFKKKSFFIKLSSLLFFFFPKMHAMVHRPFIAFLPSF